MDGRHGLTSPREPGCRLCRSKTSGQGTLTEGTVHEILTNSATHPHGIKVRLVDGVVGRVKTILPDR